ncbi:uncharacterized protein EI90DRAFT_3129671 [Cantharellus anzutake]|uniref:uncharacterized protein n=1 Tax=Cantharellus anzutake TaxID=1750568 RepID=UPI00190742CE|nr:uncharacterized protein EI90DRAFT_3129671 [Cantharellus anzutake]KAF8324708.1 hypothetical protein EI90DRAFT_3129671 [Cantharellus anzutake]
MTCGEDEVRRATEVDPQMERSILRSVVPLSSPPHSSLAYEFPEPPPALLSLRNAATRIREKSQVGHGDSEAPGTTNNPSLSHSQPLIVPNASLPRDGIEGLANNAPLTPCSTSSHQVVTEATDFFRQRSLARLNQEPSCTLSSVAVLPPPLITTSGFSGSRILSRGLTPNHTTILGVQRSKSAICTRPSLTNTESLLRKRKFADAAVLDSNITATRTHVAVTTLPLPSPDPSAVKEQALKARLIRRRKHANTAL